jgi:hypothetical protein
MPVPHQGSTLSIGGTSYDLTDLTPPNPSRESVATHNIGDTVKTFRPSKIYDPGEFSFTVQYTNADHSGLTSLLTATSNSHFVVGLGGVDVMQFSGHISAFDPDTVTRDDEDNVMASFTAKVSGPVLFS